MQRTVVRSTDRFERKRESILDAATLLLNRHGVKGLTLGDAAAAVDLSTTSLTYYFRRKDDLAAACMLRGLRRIQALVEAALDEPAPDERLRRLLRLYLEQAADAAEGRAAPLPMLADLRALNLPALGLVFDAYMKLFRRTRMIFEAPELAGLSRGRRTARTHLLLEQLFWTAAWLPASAPSAYAALGERMGDILIGGLAADGQPWAPLPIPLSAVRSEAYQDVGRDAFLLAATRVINIRGYRGASVDKISAALNVTKGSFYHHIEAKDDLVVACFERTFEIMHRVQASAAALPANAWVRLSSAAAAIGEFQLSPQGPLLRTSALSAIPEPIRSRMVGRSNQVSDRFAAMIGEGVAEGSMRPVDAAIAAQMLHATLNAAADLGFWVPGVKAKAAPAVFVRPLLTGLFSR